MSDEQLLHFVFGGELKDTQSVEFKDLTKLDFVGMYPNFAEAKKAWRAKAKEVHPDVKPGDAEAASPAACAEESQDKAVEADRSTSASAARPRQAAPHLGTGHGARESAWVSHTRFERRSPRPQEVISIRYDSHENLVAMGVIAPDRRLLPQPQAFPDSASSGYTPDPPAWR